MVNRTRWYIYTGGDQLSNEIVSDKLEGSNIDPEVPCQGSEPLPMWECKDFKIIEEFRTARSGGGLKIEIFVREGNGKAKRWGLDRKHSRSHVHKDTAERLREVLKRKNWDPNR
ncbi:MAG: hypothetical protein WCK03_01515 [Candidatus Taylorbacteria bacterium]